MAITPTSYDPEFWSTASFRSLDLYADAPIDSAPTVARLLAEYFHHSPELPTHFSYQVVGGRQRKLRTKTVSKILDTLDLVEGRLESMYIEAIRDNDHTHAVVSLGYNYSSIAREDSAFGLHCFSEDFSLETARALTKLICEAAVIDYGFSLRGNGLLPTISFGVGLRVDDDPFSKKRERWIQEFRINKPRPSKVPFLDVFELNVLSDVHLSKSVAGKSFDAYVREKGRGSLERIGKTNFLWCLDQNDIDRAKAELAGCGLVAMA
jgi:hypothetical protein